MRRKELTEALNNKCNEIKKHNARIHETKVEVTIHKAKTSYLKSQLSTAKLVHSSAFVYSYDVSLERLRIFLLANLQTDFRALNLENFKPDPISWQYLNTIGVESMPNAFPSRSPPTPPS